MREREYHPIDAMSSAPMADILKRLDHGLGSRLTCLVAGIKNPSTLSDWETGRSEPDAIQAERLRLAYWAFNTLGEHESDAVARATFIGMNPWLDDEAPVVVIGASNPRDVETSICGAVYGVIEGGFA